MRCLIVIAHPLQQSLCHHFARQALKTLTATGHTVTVEDLYSSDFPPALTAAERGSYYGATFDTAAVQPYIDRLLAAEALVLVFPTWWFGFPAMLKGWFDRVWAPGVTYDHAGDLGPIKPRLLNLRHTLAVTSLGSPWWVDHLIMRQPVKRVLKTALIGVCAPKSDFRLLSTYKAETLTTAQTERACARIEQALASWPG